MSLEKITANIASTKPGQKISQGVSYVGSKISNTLEKSPKADTFKNALSKIEPNGAVNSFIPMMTLMIGFVIFPRIATAAKRNPDDKEATRDELTEILFRDVQTVAVILLLLDAVNAVIAGKAGKSTGLPLTNKPYEQLFNSKEKGLKGLGEKFSEFCSNPLKILKKTGKNIFDTINPLGGVRALKNDEFTSKYSGYNSIKEASKMFDSIEAEGGDKDKIFNKVMDILIDEQETFINGNGKKGKNAVEGLVSKAKRMAQQNGKPDESIQNSIDNANKILEELKSIKEKGLASFNDEEISQGAQKNIIEFFEDKNNRLVMDAKGLNAMLRTGALALESSYLGFGLPALNQKRLEKKYLSSDSKNNSAQNKPMNFNPLVDRNIKAQEIKLYHNFIK